MRKGFGMIQVIMMMLILSTILTIMMKYASVTTKQTEELYLKERAEFFMQSAIEMTLLGISKHDRSGECLDALHIISDDKRFFADINISRYYLFATAGCNNEKIIHTQELTGMLMLDVVVSTNDKHPKNIYPIRLTKRTMQRP